MSHSDKGEIMDIEQTLLDSKKINIKILKVTEAEGLKQIEAERPSVDNSIEIMPWAVGTPYKEVAETVIPDKNAPWSAPLFYSTSMHKTTVGIRNVCIMAQEYLEEMKKDTPLDVLSINACMEDNRVILRILVRQYMGTFNFTGFFNYIDDDIIEDIEPEEQISTGNLVIPDEIASFSYTEEEEKQHDIAFNKQLKAYNEASKELPFLNRIKEYVPEVMRTPADSIDLIYDLKTSDMKVDTIADYEHFTKIFQEIMTYVNGVEYYHYVNVILGEESENSFMEFLEDYVNQTYVKTSRLDSEDVPAMMKKLYRALFQLYVIQDLIDDPQVTDIKITAPNAIRARIDGKAYISNIEFIDVNDYLRFVNSIAIRNGIRQTIPEQTFTDTRDENYILRFSITAAYVNSVPWPYLHIRKIDRQKPLSADLIKAGMFDEKIRDYLLDCGRTSRGVVFAGPPGSGKTVCLNWFLEEAYEQSAEILVIQENDELFAYRKGVMFQHVVNYSARDEMPVNLEQLGQLALVAGANVFIIGEAKGAEICSAITLSNSGCRTAITIHSPSSTETIDKMADLALRGYANDIDQAKRMLKSFQTIVYLEGFKIREISEITGYNEERHEMEYRYIYRRGADSE